MKLRLSLFAAIFFIATPITHSQGCAQCRDNMQATPLSVQLAYRHAIELLAISGITVFAGGIVLLRKFH